MKCVYCQKPLERGTAIFCRPCWFRLPTPERINFQRQYQRAPKNPQAWGPTLARCVRVLQEIPA